jgi:hypothetical protein
MRAFRHMLVVFARAVPCPPTMADALGSTVVGRVARSWVQHQLRLRHQLHGRTVLMLTASHGVCFAPVMLCRRGAARLQTEGKERWKPDSDDVTSWPA